MHNLDELLILATKEINSSNMTVDELQKLKIKFLGKRSKLNLIQKQLSNLSNIDDRKNLGIKLNNVKQEISKLLKSKQKLLEDNITNIKLNSDKIDLTIPNINYNKGSIHPITQTLEELINICSNIGFDVKYGSSIEEEWYNFTALNIDELHPARKMHDTFYLYNYTNSKSLLRTHTSSVQIRAMLEDKPPYMFISPGRVYRSDLDITHTPMFHQIEGLVVSNDIHMGHLKYCIKKIINTFFNSNIDIRFRPSFFPFTEPSAEVDIRLPYNKDKRKWLEILGCGIVHPNVLKNVNIDPLVYKGFAFGLGVERFAMIKYNIQDIRQFYENDLRWLEHVSFLPLDIPNLFKI